MWFIDPTLPSPIAGGGDDKEPWNGEFYVSYGHEMEGRRWEDARKYGYVSGGGGVWYSKTLSQLEIGKRIWVNVPGQGYVGVGIVAGPVVKVDEFEIENNKLLTEHDVVGKNIFKNKDDEEKSEYLVKVNWIKTLDLNQAIKEKGFFGNQNTVCKPITKTWQHTVERLKKRFDVA
jgi:hypothetical protein